MVALATTTCKKVSKFGYEIQRLWRLSPPISLALAKHHQYLKAPPQKYNYAPDRLLADFSLHSTKVVLDRRIKARKKRRIVETVEEETENKGKKARTDMEYTDDADAPPSK